jgi:hypothetical protein
MPTTLRLESVRRTEFDAGLARIGGGKLTRAGQVVYLESDCGIDAAAYQLALTGIRVTRCSSVPGPAPAMRPAIAFTLVPLAHTFQAIDVVEIRQISLSEASATLTHRRVPWLRGSRERDACRRLLRGQDSILGWRRIVWCSVSALRAARTRARLRPVVFDVAGVERRPLRWTYTSDGAIERWAFT